MRIRGITKGATVCFIVLISFGCRGFAYRNVAAGMVPTLNVDDAFTVNPYAYTNHPVERFDIIYLTLHHQFEKLPAMLDGSKELLDCRVRR